LPVLVLCLHKHIRKVHDNSGQTSAMCSRGVQVHTDQIACTLSASQLQASWSYHINVERCLYRPLHSTRLLSPTACPPVFSHSLDGAAFTEVVFALGHHRLTLALSPHIPAQTAPQQNCNTRQNKCHHSVSLTQYSMCCHPPPTGCAEFGSATPTTHTIGTRVLGNFKVALNHCGPWSSCVASLEDFCKVTMLRRTAMYVVEASYLHM
jgi:hypothetical protein